MHYRHEPIRDLHAAGSSAEKPLVDGRYELLEVLASGGMASVWRARDTRLGRDVALKRPHPAPPGDLSQLRLEREARAAAALSHPHLVTVYDAGRDDQGVYLVMELVDGADLAAAAPEPDRATALDIGAQIGDALAAIHAAGIIHRDVKPANILMAERGALLTDFGIAVDDAGGRLTRTGTVLATPSYAAPEVLAGERPTPKSDVYSLAVVIYELLAGRHPFPGGDRTADPPPLDAPALDGLLRDSLAADPAARPDAAALTARLRAAAPTRAAPLPLDLGGAGGSTIPLQAPAAPTDGVARSRLPWVIVAAVVLALVVAAFAPGDGEGFAAGTFAPAEPETEGVDAPATAITDLFTATVMAGGDAMDALTGASSGLDAMFSAGSEQDTAAAGDEVAESAPRDGGGDDKSGGNKKKGKGKKKRGGGDD